MIAGNGTIDSTDTDVSIENAGRIEPGESPGKLIFAGGLVLLDSSIIEIDLAGTAQAGTDYDLVEVVGDLTLAGNVETHLTDGYTPATDDNFDFITYTGTLSGAFAAEPVAPLGVSFNPLVIGTGSISISIDGVGSVRIWINPGSGNWSNQANWSDGDTLGIPGTGDVVSISQPGDLTITINTNNPAIASLDSQETILLTGSGVLDITTDAVIQTLAQTGGTLTGSGVVTVTDLYDWTNCVADGQW